MRAWLHAGLRETGDPRRATPGVQRIWLQCVRKFEAATGGEEPGDRILAAVFRRVGVWRRFEKAFGCSVFLRVGCDVF